MIEKAQLKLYDPKDLPVLLKLTQKSGFEMRNHHGNFEIFCMGLSTHICQDKLFILPRYNTLLVRNLNVQVQQEAELLTVEKNRIIKTFNFILPEAELYYLSRFHAMP